LQKPDLIGAKCVICAIGQHRAVAGRAQLYHAGRSNCGGAAPSLSLRQMALMPVVSTLVSDVKICPALPNTCTVFGAGAFACLSAILPALLPGSNAPYGVNSTSAWADRQKGWGRWATQLYPKRHSQDGSTPVNSSITLSQSAGGCAPGTAC
jgi:hypothetical protein